MIWPRKNENMNPKDKKSELVEDGRERLLLAETGPWTAKLVRGCFCPKAVVVNLTIRRNLESHGARF